MVLQNCLEYNGDFSNRMKWIEYNEQDIFYIDFSNLQGEEFLKLLKEQDSYLKTLEKQDILFLLNIKNMFFDNEIKEKIKESAKLISLISKKFALVGLTGLKKILLGIINRITSLGAKGFSNEQDAKIWLVN